MPTNEERKRIAARLRENIGLRTFVEIFGFSWTDGSDWRYGSDWRWRDVTAKVADYVEPEERTCQFVEDDELGIGGVRCTICNEPWFPENDKSRFVYCPKCGTKVVK